jgi:hypothetical protein
MKMKITIFIPLLLVFFLHACSENNAQSKSDNPKAIIELEMFGDLGWEPVIEIKNCGSNRDMAIDIIEGLALVQIKNGRKPRTYRIIQQGFEPAEVRF